MMSPSAECGNLKEIYIKGRLPRERRILLRRNELTVRGCPEHLQQTTVRTFRQKPIDNGAASIL
jgi:hypothetical protein